MMEGYGENIPIFKPPQERNIAVMEGDKTPSSTEKADIVDMFLDGIVQEGQELSLTDEEIKASAGEIMVAEIEFAKGKKDEVSRDG